MKYYIYSILAIFCLALTSCKSDEDETSSQTTDLDDDNTTEKINDSYVYQLPVIFHVLYSDKNDDTQYISATQIQKIMANVNEIYKGNVYGESENINLKFILATKRWKRQQAEHAWCGIREMGRGISHRREQIHEWQHGDKREIHLGPQRIY